MFRRCTRLHQQPATSDPSCRQLYSHIVGAHLYCARPQSALQFYTYIFQAAAAAATTAATSTRTGEGQQNASARHQVAVPQVLLPSQSIAIAPLTIEGIESCVTMPAAQYDTKHKNVPRWALKVAHNANGPLMPLTAPTDASAPLQQGPVLEYLLVGSSDAALCSLHAAGLCAPFAVQPSRTTGVLNWCDLAVADGEESATAAAAAEAFQWRRAQPMKFPSSDGTRMHQYITTLNAASSGGGAQNRDKMCGILPLSVLLPKWTRAQRTVVPFFSVPNVEALRAAREVALGLGGAVHNAELEADGFVSLLQDAEGLPFALYARNDMWDAVKLSTVLATDS